MAIALIWGCVPARQLDDSKAREKQCQEENAKLKDANQQLTTGNNELKADVEQLRKQVNDLVADTIQQGHSSRRLSDLYNELMKSYDKLLANNEKLLSGNTEETRKLIAQLNELQKDLQLKEDRLRRDSLALIEREGKLGELRTSLEDRQRRVDELQGIIDQSDSTVGALKKAVSDALLGFENKGLTVKQSGSRVYVSMEERLLFASGSTSVEKQGEEALRELSKVLEKNPDINVTVEGHTDNVPINGVLPSGARDNWELSVLRATSVTKILLKGTTIDPLRVTAAGRGPYLPVDPANTPEARKKNRRTEVILSPKFDELLKVLEQIGRQQ
jgi:chemotaxis protein MotB